MYAHKVSHNHGWVHQFLHHLQLAILVASVVALLHIGGYLGWLDAAMLRLAASVQDQAVPPENQHAAPTPGMPVVFILGQAMYERDFAQTSPLDRRKLARVIATLAPGAHQPATQAPKADWPAALVVDIDLSPVPDPAQKAGQQELDKVLKALVTGGTRLVLVMPFRVATAPLVAEKAAWMRNICEMAPAQAGEEPPTVIFALGEMMTNMGQVLRYAPHRPTLGIAANPARTTEAAHICEALLKPDGVQQWQDVLLSSAYRDDAVDALVGHPPAHPSYLPFNPTLLPELLAGSATLTALDARPPALDGGAYQLAGRTVFLGGSFDRADNFVAPLSAGNLPGVMLHALVYASGARGVHAWHGNPPYFGDIGVGLMCAFGFHWIWLWHRRVAMHAQQRGGMLAYSLAKLAWWANLVVLLAVLTLLTYSVARFLYPWGYWLDPGPVLLGVGAKYLFANMQVGPVGTDPHPHSEPPRLHARLDWVLVLALAAFTVGLNQIMYSH